MRSEASRPSGGERKVSPRSPRRWPAGASPSRVSTGFVGTALVERLLRQVPGCGLRRSCARVGGRLGGPAGGSGDPPQRRLRPTPCSARQGRLRGWRRGGARYHRRRHRHRRPRAGRGRPRRCSPPATSSSSTPRRTRRLRLAPRAARSRSTCSAPRGSSPCSVSCSASPPTSSRASMCYVAGNRRGRAPEAVADGPFAIGLGWKAEVAAARRLRSDAEAESRRPEMLACFRSEAQNALAWRGHLPWPPEDRATAGAVGHRSPGAGGRLWRPASVGRTPTCTRRPSASRPTELSVCRSRSCGRRSSSRPSPKPDPGWIRGSAWPNPSSSPSPGAC